MSEKICFIAAPIGEVNSEVRIRSDKVNKFVIKPAAEECGYKAIRADEISRPGLISQDIIRHIISAHLVIADLSGHNPNVFYELAVRHALGLPQIQIIEKGETIPFDVSDMRTVILDHRDLQSAYDARLEIIAQIMSIENMDSEQVLNPVSVWLEHPRLGQLLKNESRTPDEWVSAVAELQSSLANIEKRLSDQENARPLDYTRTVARNIGSSSVSSETPFEERDSKIEAVLVKEATFHQEEMKRIHQAMVKITDQAMDIGLEADGRRAAPEFEGQDIEDILYQQLAFHREQKRKIDIALTAITGGDPNYDFDQENSRLYEPEPRRPIQWSSAIDSLFHEHKQLTTRQVRSLLAEKGLPAQEDKYRPTILNTLSRKVERSLTRVSPGVYKRIEGQDHQLRPEQ